jgi:hypothetical protein
MGDDQRGLSAERFPRLSVLLDPLSATSLRTRSSFLMTSSGDRCKSVEVDELFGVITLAAQEAVMNSDELKVKKDEAKGKAESFAGRAKETLERGKDEVEGKLGQAKQAVASKRDEHARKTASEADPARGK